MDANAKYLQHIGDNLRKLRDEKGLSQQELADIANVAKSTIQRIEKGTLNPTITVLKTLSEAMEVNLSSLVE